MEKLIKQLLAANKSLSEDKVFIELLFGDNVAREIKNYLSKNKKDDGGAALHKLYKAIGYEDNRNVALWLKEILEEIKKEIKEELNLKNANQIGEVDQSDDKREFEELKRIVRVKAEAKAKAGVEEVTDAGAGAGAKNSAAVDPKGDPKFDKYTKMKKMRLPEGAIRQKMTTDGLTPDQQDAFFRADSPQATQRNESGKKAGGEAKPETEVGVSDVDPKFAKYKRMQELGLPDGAIRQKMAMEDISESEQKSFFDPNSPQSTQFKGVGAKSASSTTGLLGEIQGGVNLKKAVAVAKSAPSTSGGLLDELKRGVKLKNAGERRPEKKAVAAGAGAPQLSVMEELERALKQRKEKGSDALKTGSVIQQPPKVLAGAGFNLSMVGQARRENANSGSNLPNQGGDDGDDGFDELDQEDKKRRLMEEKQQKLIDEAQKKKLELCENELKMLGSIDAEFNKGLAGFMKKVLPVGMAEEVQKILVSQDMQRQKVKLLGILFKKEFGVQFNCLKDKGSPKFLELSKKLEKLASYNPNTLKQKQIFLKEQERFRDIIYSLPCSTVPGTGAVKNSFMVGSEFPVKLKTTTEPDLKEAQKTQKAQAEAKEAQSEVQKAQAEAEEAREELERVKAQLTQAQAEAEEAREELARVQKAKAEEKVEEKDEGKEAQPTLVSKISGAEAGAGAGAGEVNKYDVQIGQIKDLSERISSKYNERSYKIWYFVSCIFCFKSRIDQKMAFVENVINNIENLGDKEQLGVLIQESEDNVNITKGRKKRGSCCFHLVNELKGLQDSLPSASEM